MKKTKIAIIGAGISGITLARELEKFAQVKIFEKSRGVGGRMSTRHSDKFSFDHGAQCFTARTNLFQDFLKPYILSGDVRPWFGKAINIEDNGNITPRFWFETHLVAAPNMNSLCKKLSYNLDINLLTEVAPLKIRSQDGWHLQNKDYSDLGNYDLVISTAPPAQTKNLFGANFNIKEVKMQPCYALMLGFERKWEHDWIFAKIRNNPIKLISVNSTKPQRNSEITSLVIQTNNLWSQENIARNQDEIQQILLQNFTHLTKINHQDATYKSLHLWRYALIDDTNERIFFNPDLGLAATSDWTTTSRIEDVWIAATNLAKVIKNLLL